MATGKDGYKPMIWYSKTGSYSLGQWQGGYVTRSKMSYTPATGYATVGLMGFNTGSNNCCASHISSTGSNVFRIYNRAGSTTSGTVTGRFILIESAAIY